MSYAAAARALNAAETVAITSHVNPDADGIGAALALRLALQGLGKRVRLVLPSPAPRGYAFLPGLARVEVVEEEERMARRRPVDVLVACDCGDVERLGPVAAQRRGRLINLDHHASNDRFGDINVVDLQCECTGRVVAGIIKRLGVALDHDIAACLYAALVFDTGRFMHSNTSAATFRFAARLLATGIDAAAINRALSYTRTPHDLALQRLALDRLAVDPEEPRLAGIALSAADIAAVGAPEDWGDLVEIPRSLVGVEIAYLLREQPDRTSVRCSLRANPPWAVGPVAEELGGGGHRQAAGVTVSGDLEAVRAALLARLRTAAQAVRG